MNSSKIANEPLATIIKKYAELAMFEDYEIVAPDSVGPDGDTPFHMAAFDGDIDAAKIMLPYVSDMNASGDNGCTPLHYAVLHRQPEMAKFLIQNGADINSKDDYGDTPIDYMENRPDFDNFFDGLSKD